jgi:tetratricopeptide (TPR) repeat protein
MDKPVETDWTGEISRAVSIGVFVASTIACSAVPNEMGHLPMYGGIDRQAVPAFRSADEKLIEGSIQAFKTRERASDVSVDHGFKFVAQKEYSMAMKRFNQAWVLNPDNPQAYWGFGTVLVHRGQPCDAVPLLEKALSYKVAIAGLATEAAQAYTTCAMTNATLNPAEKAEYLERARKLVEPDTLR